MDRKSFLCLLGFWVLSTQEAVWSQPSFLRGDANGDGYVSLSDEVMLQRHLFAGGVGPACRDSADTNDDGAVNIGDQIHILELLADPQSDGWNAVLPEPYPQPGKDPTADDLDCTGYTVEPPDTASDMVIQLREISAGPGDSVRIPVLLTNPTLEVEAVQLVLRYDPSLITPFAVALGEYYRQFADSPFFGPLHFLNAHPAEEVFTVAIVGTLAYPGFQVTAGELREIGAILAHVAADTPEGVVVSLTPENGPENQGVGPHRMRNEVTYEGTARFVAVLTQVSGGEVKIVNPDLVDFLRGDANTNGEVTLSDPIFTLFYLFAGGRPPLCPDAADFNDDGAVAVSDAISTLGHLFGVPPSAPINAALTGLGCGRDATKDALATCSASPCTFTGEAR